MKNRWVSGKCFPANPCCPVLSRFFSPLLFAGSFPSISISALKIRAVIFCSIRRIDCKVTVPSSRIHLPAAALNIPRVKIIPLCVFTCPVARYMASSASIPVLRISRKRSSGVQVSWYPWYAILTNHGYNASALFSKVCTSISVWAPQEYGSTEPGLWNRIDFLKQCLIRHPANRFCKVFCSLHCLILSHTVLLLYPITNNL